MFLEQNKLHVGFEELSKARNFPMLLRVERGERHDIDYALLRSY